MDEFLIDEDQREAALAHLGQEHARGALDSSELERRTTGVRTARTVAELLAATADPPEAIPASRQPAVRTGVVALVAGLAVAVLLAAIIFSRLA
jgi:hypothetical protein